MDSAVHNKVTLAKQGQCCFESLGKAVAGLVFKRTSPWPPSWACGATKPSLYCTHGMGSNLEELYIVWCKFLGLGVTPDNVGPQEVSTCGEGPVHAGIAFSAFAAGGDSVLASRRGFAAQSTKVNVVVEVDHMLTILL